MKKICLVKMEKRRSLPDYSSSYYGEFEMETRANAYSFNGPSSKGQGFTPPCDPELKRKKRIAAYNMFTSQRKLKSTSMRESVKWIRNKFSDVRYSLL